MPSVRITSVMPSATITSTAICSVTLVRLAIEKKFGVRIVRPIEQHRQQIDGARCRAAATRRSRDLSTMLRMCAGRAHVHSPSCLAHPIGERGNAVVEIEARLEARILEQPVAGQRPAHAGMIRPGRRAWSDRDHRLRHGGAHGAAPPRRSRSSCPSPGDRRMAERLGLVGREQARRHVGDMRVARQEIVAGRLLDRHAAQRALEEPGDRPARVVADARHQRRPVHPRDAHRRRRHVELRAIHGGQQLAAILGGAVDVGDHRRSGLPGSASAGSGAFWNTEPVLTLTKRRQPCRRACSSRPATPPTFDLTAPSGSGRATLSLGTAAVWIAPLMACVSAMAAIAASSARSARTQVTLAAEGFRIARTERAAIGGDDPMVTRRPPAGQPRSQRGPWSP